ncbi:MAG: glycosyltransferase family 4 protein, partial [Bacteroidaceae bacterium]|nr:glycosyltransferase family 4 protein [Bacteroidaceae bacterium]
VRDADIYLSTSLFEGTSNSIMEAMNWSLPVVATNVGDNNHLVIDGVNGTLHPIGDAKGMAESIANLLTNYELRKEYGLASNKNLRENYSMEIFEKRYLKLIEK